MRLEPPARGDSALEDSSVVAAFSVSEDGVLLKANSRFAALLGIPRKQLPGTALSDLLREPADFGVWKRRWLGGARDLRLSFSRADGKEVVLRGDLRSVAASDHKTRKFLEGIFVDVTEEEQLRRALQASARMEALGSLTSGIAHDFNNLLTILVGNLYLAAEEVRNDPKAFAKLKSARDAAKRGGDLIRQLLAFAKRESLAEESVDAGRVLDGLAPLLRRALGSKVVLETRIESGAGSTRCNAAQLESVIVNLAVNARDAMENGGKIVIALDVTECSERSGVELPRGEYVRIAVTDDGAGIEPDALRRVFEPFFTTKKDRGGTGLGLSMVRWFAEQAGGAVAIESTRGKGTCVTLLLPRIRDRTAETATKTMPLSTLPGGNESILVVAREEGVRLTLQQVLEVLGYSVRVVADPAEALRKLREAPADLMILDVGGYADASARRLLADAREAHAPLRVLLVGDQSESRRGEGPVIGKPFSIADVARAVRAALQGDRRGR